MASGVDSGSDPGSQDPYSRLGITADSGFDEVQKAKAAALSAAGDDPQARAKVEAAYDAVLMARLRERQTGKISVAAATASELSLIHISEPTRRRGSRMPSSA